jgi:hypothetical protein
MEFTTLPGYDITIQKSGNLAPGSWKNLAFVEGSGVPASFSHSGIFHRQFYRLSIQSPVWPPNDPSLASNLGSFGNNGVGTYLDSPRLIGGPLAAESSNWAVHQSLASYGGTVKIPFTPDLSPAGAFSIEIWVKPARSGLNTTGYSPQFAVSREIGGRGWVLGQYPVTNTVNQDGFSFLCSTSGSSFVAASISTPVDTSRWYHVVGVFDGSTVKLYLDGVLAQSSTFSSGQTFLPSLRNGISFGSNNGGRWFEGEFDEAAFYPHALSAAQVLAHYQAGINPAPPVPYPQVILADNPAGYWRFNEP